MKTTIITPIPIIALGAVVAVFCFSNAEKIKSAQLKSNEKITIQVEADIKTMDSLIQVTQNCMTVCYAYREAAQSCLQTGPSKQCDRWIDSAQKYLDLATYFNHKADSVNNAAKVLNDKINSSL